MTLTNEQDNRNVVYWGKKNQKKLYDSRVTVVGSDTLAQMAASCLAGIGVGNISLIDNKRINKGDLDFLCFAKDDNVWNIGKKKVEQICGLVSRINQSPNVVPLHSKFVEAFCYNYLHPDIIIDATNDSTSKYNVLKYSRDMGIPMVSVSSNYHTGIISCFKPSEKKIDRKFQKIDVEAMVHNEYEELMQGSHTSGVIAGLAVEEVRKYLFKIDGNDYDNNLENCKRLYFNPYSNSRNTKDLDLNKDNTINLRNKSALVVGAGALGNFVSLNLALLGIGSMDIVDGDIIEPTNLNRQILLYDRIGQSKVETLQERIKKIDPKIKVNPINKFLEGKDPVLWENPNKYDVVFGCLDNREARMIVDSYCTDRCMPYIDGGTSPSAGQVAIYMPDKSPSICRQVTFSKKKRSCMDEPDPSVVMSNIIIGSAMVGEAFHVMSKFSDSYEVKGIVSYDAFTGSRIYLRKIKGVGGKK